MCRANGFVRFEEQEDMLASYDLTDRGAEMDYFLIAINFLSIYTFNCVIGILFVSFRYYMLSIFFFLFFLFRTVSTLHAIVVGLFCLYILFFDEAINQDPVW